MIVTCKYAKYGAQGCGRDEAIFPRLLHNPIVYTLTDDAPVVYIIVYRCAC